MIIITDSLIFYTFVLYNFIFFADFFSYRLSNNKANKLAANISQEAKSALKPSTYFHMLDDLEKKKYRGKFGLWELWFYLFVFVIFTLIFFHDESALPISMIIVFLSPYAWIFPFIIIRYILLASPQKEFYRVNAFCTRREKVGTQSCCYFAYYNFFNGCYEGCCVKTTPSMMKKNILPGVHCEVILTPQETRMQVIDVI